MRRQDLSEPRQGRRLGIHYDPDAFGQFSEGIARYLGTARFLVYQSVIIVGWILTGFLVLVILFYAAAIIYAITTSDNTSSY